jgi:hypothetical protein
LDTVKLAFLSNLIATRTKTKASDKVMEAYLALALLATSSLGHICIIEPRQRGTFSISEPGDPSCYRRTPDCGGVAAGPISGVFVEGQVATIKFQQNLNHWHTPKPGFLDLTIGSTLLARIPDYAANDMIAQTNFSLKVLIPEGAACDSCVLKARYVSYNPLEVDPANNTDAIFYK